MLTLPEHIQRPRRHEETSNTHPEPVCKSRYGQRDHKNRHEGRDQNDKTLSGEKIEEEV